MSQDGTEGISGETGRVDHGRGIIAVDRRHAEFKGAFAGYFREGGRGAFVIDEQEVPA